MGRNIFFALFLAVLFCLCVSRLTFFLRQSLPPPPTPFRFSTRSSPSVLISLQMSIANLLGPTDKQHYYPTVTPSTVYLVNSTLDPNRTLISYATGPIYVHFICVCDCVRVCGHKETPGPAMTVFVQLSDITSSDACV